MKMDKKSAAHHSGGPMIDQQWIITPPSLTIDSRALLSISNFVNKKSIFVINAVVSSDVNSDYLLLLCLNMV